MIADINAGLLYVLALTSVGVYGGVLVPGLLLMGVSPLFAAPLSLFLQVLIVPFGASAHVRLGNVSKPIVIPLVAGGVIGAVLGPVVASVFDAKAIAVVVEVLIIIGAGLLLLSLPLKHMQVSRDPDDVPRARIGGNGLGNLMFTWARCLAAARKHGSCRAQAVGWIRDSTWQTRASCSRP